MGQDILSVDNFFPFWKELPKEIRRELEETAKPRAFMTGETLLPYRDQCLGLLFVQDGRFRVFILSDKGKDVTLYRLFSHDACLFTSDCVMNTLPSEIHLEAERESRVLVISSAPCRGLLDRSPEISGYTGGLMSSRFSGVTWVMEQILHNNMDRRIARHLLDKAGAAGTKTLRLTCETLAGDLDTHPETAAGMLNYLRDENLLELDRDRITLLDTRGLEEIANQIPSLH